MSNIEERVSATKKIAENCDARDEDDEADRDDDHTIFKFCRFHLMECMYHVDDMVVRCSDGFVYAILFSAFD
jgi:hypothetical protein